MYDKRAIRLIVLFFFVFLLYHAMTIFLPFSLSILIDFVLPSGRTDWLLWWALGFALAYVVYHLYYCYVVDFLCFKFEINLGQTFINKLTGNILNMPYKDYLRFDSGKLFNVLLNDSSTVIGIDLQAMIHLTSYGAGVAGAAILLYLTAPPLAVISLIGIPLFVLLTVVFKDRLEKLQTMEREQMDSLISASKNILDKKRSVNILKAEAFFFAQYDRILRTWIKFRLKYWFYYLPSLELPKMFSAMIKVGILLVGAFDVMNGNSTLGTLILSSSIVGVLFTSVDELLFKVLRRKANLAAYTRVRDLMFVEKDRSAPDYITPGSGLEISEVSVRFGDDFGLEIPSLSLPDKGICLISGKNGSGKSTVLNLFLDMLGNGSVSVSGHVHAGPAAAGKIAYLSAPYIFVEDTVRNNILLGRAPTELFHKMVDLLSLGPLLDKKMSLSPINLSYGEQQKIALCRVLIEDLPILFLDEPFVNLDQKTTQALLNYLLLLRETRLLVLVSHELELEAYADRVYQIEQGTLRLGTVAAALV
jgi:ATP-binding cassette subfamily B protein